MPKESFAKVVKRRLLGVLMLALVVALISLSIAIYNKVFTKTVDVTLMTNEIGNQLQVQSDVKERGVIVGDVKAVRSNGSHAIVTLSLEPGRVKDIPRNVTAQVLPKTLFGEQYVSLLLPHRSNGHTNNPIAAGDVIHQDHTKGSIEAQQVFNNLYPALTYVQPAELNSTLTAIATALHGRGKELGQTLVNLHKYLLQINPHTDELVNDIGKLGQVATEYNDVSPDLFATLKNLETNVRTIVARRAALDSLLTTGTSTSNVISSFLSDNRSRLIEVTGQSQKIYGLLAEYSPEFSCLAKGVNILANGADQAIYNGSIHLNVVVDGSTSSVLGSKTSQSRGAYSTSETPSLITGYGANCFGLPNHPTPTDNGNFQIPAKYRCLNDGAPLSDAPCAANRTSTNSKRDRALTTASASPEQNVSSGSATEDAMVNAIVSTELHTTPNKVPGGTTLLAAPLLRGHKVVIK
ncbi:MCE family protein [Jatrophihabitans endophyticus]|uniref:MCE family protein n=1 Tax=Jatrophihabitans endophyticus TaxID=1206085 RepID=UPI001A036EE9|nr:MCE family protein [Jatrophihabitans endophyticus]MBE7188173.1 MCE family protein [Jatrophihabitans endophyticus]